MEDKECYQRHEKLNKDMGERFEHIRKDIADLPDKLSKKFASKLTEKLVYTFCGMALLSIVSAIIGLVVYAK